MPNAKISALTSATTPLAGTETLPVVQSGVTKQVSVANLTAGRAVSLGVSTIIGPDQTTSNITTASNIDAEILSTGSSVASGGSLVFGAASGAWKFASLKGLATDGGGNSQGSLSISTRRNAADATLTESIRFHPSGGISINSGTDPLVGNLLLGTGNLVQGTATKGINFTANTPAAGMTSQLLNWYEEGTWTPADASGASLTFTSVTARFVRIGKQVSITATLTYPTTASASQAKISGLPYAPAVSGQLLLASPGNSSNAPGQGLIAASSTTIDFVSQNNLVKTNALLSTLVVYFNGSYIV
jgi:hypothetical protein